MKKNWILLIVALLTCQAFAGCSSDPATQDDSEAALQVERLTCYQRDKYTVGALLDGPEPAAPAAEDSSFCSSTLLAGTETPLLALLRNADGVEEVVSGPTEWIIDGPGAEISEGGVLTAIGSGDVTVTVCVEGVCSDPFPFTIIEDEDAEVIALEIFPNMFFPLPLMDANMDAIAAPDVMCLDCPFWYELRLLIGDTAQFFAQGILETGTFRDLTQEVEWHSRLPDFAAIDATGLLSAQAEGSTTVTAEYDDLTSNEVKVDVLAEAVLTGLYIERQSLTGIIEVGGIEQFHAVAYYDPWTVQDRTSEVEWILSDPSLGIISEEGIFTALAPEPGKPQPWVITIKATYQGRLSDNEIEIEVWGQGQIEFCDPENPNRSIWEDEYNRVILETDCGSYTRPDNVKIRYTIEEKIAPPWGILDPCLDLVILDEEENPVKTLRFEGCGELPFDLAAGASEALKPIYQYVTTWDLTNDGGAQVPLGKYVVAGRFFIYYDPVIHLDVTVLR